MAHERYTRTNQKLYFAGLAVQSCRQAQQANALDGPGRALAEREAALFHLHGAVLGLCHEIAGFYRLADDGSPHIEQFLQENRLADTPSPELLELAELIRQPHSWLGLLLHAHGQLLQPPRGPAKAKPDVSMPLIALAAVDEEVELLGPETLEEWRGQLTRLALRFRQGMTES